MRLNKTLRMTLVRVIGLALESGRYSVKEYPFLCNVVETLFTRKTITEGDFNKFRAFWKELGEGRYTLVTYLLDNSENINKALDGQDRRVRVAKLFKCTLAFWAMVHESLKAGHTVAESRKLGLSAAIAAVD